MNKIVIEMQFFADKTLLFCEDGEVVTAVKTRPLSLEHFEKLIWPVVEPQQFILSDEDE